MNSKPINQMISGREFTLFKETLNFGNRVVGKVLNGEKQIHEYAVTITADVSYKIYLKPTNIPQTPNAHAKTHVARPARRSLTETPDLTPAAAGEPPFGSSVAHGDGGNIPEYRSPVEVTYYFQVREERDTAIAGPYSFGVAPSATVDEWIEQDRKDAADRVSV